MFVYLGGREARGEKYPPRVSRTETRSPLRLPLAHYDPLIILSISVGVPVVMRSVNSMEKVRDQSCEFGRGGGCGCG